MALEDRFIAAVKVIQSLPKDGPYQPSNSTKLRFYSLYKQGTEGKCYQSQPSFFNIVNRAKWDAWNKLGDMTKEEAMLEYIDELKKIIETMSFSGDVQNFLETLGPFYEFVNQEGSGMNHIKKSLDEWTSSSSSLSSSQTNSSQGSPIKHIHSDDSEDTYLEQKEERLTVMNGHGFGSTMNKSKSNGHLPNQDYQNQPQVSSSYSPPSAPVHHRASIPNGFISHGHGAGLSSDETSDEILKLDMEEDTNTSLSRRPPLEPKVSVETMHSGTDSEKYYSGDSEPEVEASGSTSSGTFIGEHFPSHDSYSVPVMVISNGVARKSKSWANQRVTQTSPHYPASTSPDFVLQNAVERLNRDVDHILARLRILEAAYATNGQFPNGGNAVQRGRRRPFGEISKSTLTLIFAWPFVAYFIIKLVKMWLSRRRVR